MIDTLPTAPTVAPAEPTTPIRPSEALRLGRLEYPNRIEAMFWDEAERGACALGAIITGGGYEAIRDRRHERCPACPALTASASVMHLVDIHHWDDGQIIDHLIGLGL